MFITKAEKEELRISVRTLQAKVKELEVSLRLAQSAIIDLEIKKPAIKDRRKIIKTAEAPWGSKKDGSPRKRPGRPKLTMNVSKP